MSLIKSISFRNHDEELFDVYVENDSVIICNREEDATSVYIEIPLEEWGEIVDFIQKNLK